MPRLVDQIKEALIVFANCETPPALIGGLALAVHKYVRATQDVDFLVDAIDADRLHESLIQLGYRCIHRSEDAANYLRGDEGMDFVYARRPASRRLLVEAPELEAEIGRLHVVSAEGLIGFKLQAFVNNPRRTRDIEDIRSLLRANRSTLNMSKVEQYFVLFERKALLDELLAEDGG